MSTIYTKEVLQEYLREIFPKEDLQSVATVRIGGMSNFNYKVDISGSSYVLRIPGHGSAGMVERNYELYNSALAYELGINPKVLYFDAYTGIKLTEYIDNVVTFNGKSIQKEDNLERAAGILLNLHNSEKTFANRLVRKSCQGCWRKNV